jgi:hypothetical protein
MGRPVVHFEIMGADGEALERFYGGLFGWRIEPVEETQGGYRIVHTDAGRGIDGGLGAFPGAPAYTTVYVHVDDLEDAVAQAQALGGTVLAPPREVSPGVFSAILRDPEGHVIGLIRGAGFDPPAP